MIKEEELLEAIAECQGERNPNANTCIKLAAYYTILNEIYPKEDPGFSMSPGYSYSNGTITYDGNSEFAALIQGMDQDHVLSIMEELMDTLSVINPKLYDATIRRLSEK